MNLTTTNKREKNHSSKRKESQGSKRIYQILKENKVFRKMSSSPESEEWRNSPTPPPSPSDFIQNPRDSREEGEISPRSEEEELPSVEQKGITNWVLKETEMIPVSKAELELITTNMWEELFQKPRNDVERNDLVKAFKLQRSLSKRTAIHHVDLTKSFKGQGLAGSWMAFAKRVNEDTLEAQMKKLLHGRKQYSLSEIRRNIHEECIKINDDCVVALAEGYCKLCSDCNLPRPSGDSIHNRKKSSSSYLENCIAHYLSVINRNQKRQRLSYEEEIEERGYVPKGTAEANKNVPHGTAVARNVNATRVVQNEVFTGTPFATSVSSIVHAGTRTHRVRQEHPPQEYVEESKCPDQVGSPPSELGNVVTNDERGTFYPFVADATSSSYRQKQATSWSHHEAGDQRSPRQPNAHRHGSRSKGEDQVGRPRSEGYYYPADSCEHRDSRQESESYSTLLEQVLHQGRRLDKFRDLYEKDQRETRKSLEKVLLVQKENLYLKEKMASLLAEVNKLKELLLGSDDPDKDD